MRLRVVCGFEVTMAIFCPTRRFTRVDLPAFGRPTIATNPDRNACFSPLFSLAVLKVSQPEAPARQDAPYRAPVRYGQSWHPFRFPPRQPPPSFNSSHSPSHPCLPPPPP